MAVWVGVGGWAIPLYLSDNHVLCCMCMCAVAEFVEYISKQQGVVRLISTLTPSELAQYEEPLLDTLRAHGMTSHNFDVDADPGRAGTGRFCTTQHNTITPSCGTNIYPLNSKQ